MRLVLIQPPIQDFYDTDVRLQPIGLCYLKAAIARYLPCVDVRVRDYHAGHGRRTVALPPELTYLREYYPVADKSPFSTFHNYFHFGLGFDDIVEDVAALNPDVVGISSLFTPYFRESLILAKRIKRRLNVPLILGGSHVSAAPDQSLRDSAVDYVIRGEGERPLVLLLEHLLGRRPVESVPNLGFKRGTKAVFTAMEDNYPLDELPLPDLSDLDSVHYRYEGSPMAFMITSRSYPHKYSFCSVHTTFGERFRRRTVSEVLAEIQLRYDQGYRVIDFEDDNLTFYKNEFKTLCRELINRFAGKSLRFVAMNGISYMSLDAEMLHLMKAAGFVQLNLALVSSDKTVRETTKRPHTLEAYLRVVNTAQALGFHMVSYQILGLPMESLDSMVQTLCFNAGLPVLLGASPYYQTPNAPIVRGLSLTETDYVRSRLTAFAVETDQFSRADIYTLFVITRMLNFIKGLPFARDLHWRELFNRNPPLTATAYCGDETRCDLGAAMDARTALGLELLEILFRTQVLLTVSREGRRPNTQFKYELFAQVMRGLEKIGCCNGRVIDMSEIMSRNAMAGAGQFGVGAGLK